MNLTTLELANTAALSSLISGVEYFACFVAFFNRVFALLYAGKLKYLKYDGKMGGGTEGNGHQHGIQSFWLMLFIIIHILILVNSWCRGPYGRRGK